MSWDLFNVGLVFAMVPFATLNPIAYAYVFNWRKSPEGRAVMNVLLSLAALVDFTVIFRLVPDFPSKPQITTVVFASILAGMVRLSVVILRTLRDQRRSD